ncbi:phage scaffolding protein [uncultured Secundilactobacillus sp.]|uniref:phage scaffolding protein n=2 Tax=uncultured Secundilactobacillus sp. TaxID=2813935 RepID=UPI00259195D7|nr:phage scaffolding protein [uncultured Secundilactobacillus sp.]
MKRDFLKSLELTDEQIEAVMSENGKEVKATKDEQKTLTAQIDDLNQQLKDRDADIEDLKKQAGDNSDLAQKYSDLQSKYKDDSKAWQAQNDQIKLDNALDNALVANNVRNAKTLRPLLDMDVIKLTDNGELVGLNEQLEAIKNDNGYLFDEGTKTDYSPKGGDGQNPGSDDDADLASMAADARII